MTPQKSLYRRHRPLAFDQVVAQDHVVRTLGNAVERDRVHHAYLFVGSRGTGKTTVAKILARSLNCVDGPTLTPCGKCESCLAIAAGTSLDVIEMDAASNRSVDDIRDLRERVGYVPVAGGWKVYILDEAHMLTREAWNAFLKTLEEPPPNTVFILATTEPHKVMPTIVDRCQRFDFQRPALEQIAEVLTRVSEAEGIELSDGALAAIARSAGGSFRDALGTLDQLVSYGGKSVRAEDVVAVLGVADATLILDATDAIAGGDGPGALRASEQLASSGHDVTQFARDLLAHLRQLVVIKTVGEPPPAFTVTAADPERLRSQAESITELALGRAIDTISAALAAIREGDEPRMTVELALLRCARPQLDPSREALLERLERLEAQVGAGGGDAGPTDPPPAPDRSEDDAASAAGDAAPPEPEAAAPAEPEVAASAEAEAEERVDLEKVVALWPAVIEQVRASGSELLSHVLAAARPVTVNVEDAVLEIGFPSSAAFNKRKAEASEARDRVVEAVRTVVGARLRPVYVLLDPEQEAEVPPEAALSEEELIDLVRSEFDAEEYHAEPVDGEAEAKEAGA